MPLLYLALNWWFFRANAPFLGIYCRKSDKTNTLCRWKESLSV